MCRLQEPGVSRHLSRQDYQRLMLAEQLKWIRQCREPHQVRYHVQAQAACTKPKVVAILP